MKFLIVLIFSFSYLQTISQFQFLSVLGQSRSTRNYNNKKEKIISQREIENHISPWNSGTITLSEKKEMVGLIQYNSLEDILIFHNENESKTFNPSNLLRFEYWDSVNNEQKFFQTLPYTDSQGKTQYAFFEILKELDDFAVVSKLKFTDFNVNRVYDPLSNAPIYIGKKTKTTYNEVIYIVNMQGDITPYIGITYKEKNGVFTSTSQTKNKILDEDLLRKQIGILYKQLEDYAAANKLKFEYKPDLINLLNYYSDIIKEKK